VSNIRKQKKIFEPKKNISIKNKKLFQKIIFKKFKKRKKELKENYNQW
jgi:hypothetical protein